MEDNKMGIGIVQTKYGKLQGVEVTEGKYAGITYFKGVRYAASAEGENRFKPPDGRLEGRGYPLFYEGDILGQR